jgi:hypothetical protein
MQSARVVSRADSMTRMQLGRTVSRIGSMAISFRWTPMSMLLFLDSLAVLTGKFEHQGVTYVWGALVCLFMSGLRLPEVPGRVLSSVVAVSWGIMMGHPMRFLHVLGALELCFPTCSSPFTSQSGETAPALMIAIRRVVVQAASMATSVGWTPMTMMLCVDFIPLFTGTPDHQGVRYLWVALLCLAMSGFHLPDIPCRVLSSVMVVLWGTVMGHPMRFLQLVGVLELCYSTFGKRAAPGSDKSCHKRPASAAAEPIPENNSQWDAKVHDAYLRGLLADNPAVSEADIMVAILRDHGLTIERNKGGYYSLFAHMKSVRSMPLTRAQLSEFYTSCVQEQRRAGKEGRALHKWFLQPQL